MPEQREHILCEADIEARRFWSSIDTEKHQTPLEIIKRISNMIPPEMVKSVNYVSTTEPQLYKGEPTDRKMVKLSVRRNLGLEMLKLGLKERHCLKLRASSTLGTEEMFLVPYVHFKDDAQEGENRIEKLLLVALSPIQVEKILSFK